MARFTLQTSVGEIVAQQPQTSRTFEKMGIDYCCGGKKTLEEACQKKGLDPDNILYMLEEIASVGSGTHDEVKDMSLSELADHIEKTHHAYLRKELPRLEEIARKVALAHGEHDVRLYQVREIIHNLAEELFSHMLKEERILFPIIRQMEKSENMPVFHCGTIANPIWQMEHEHDETGEALQALRRLTDNFTLPKGACNTYRVMIHELSTLEEDLHRHIHKENNILFPHALELEKKGALHRSCHQH